MAVSYLFNNTPATGDSGQYETPTKTTPLDVGGVTEVTVIINSGVARGNVEKILRKAIKYASSDYASGIAP